MCRVKVADGEKNEECILKIEKAGEKPLDLRRERLLSVSGGTQRSGRLSILYFTFIGLDVSWTAKETAETGEDFCCGRIGHQNNEFWM